MPKRAPTGRRYTEAQKRRILEAAERDGLTGAQVKKRFGVSTLSFYKWRGPVGHKKRSLMLGSFGGGGGIRDEVRAHLSRVLPRLIEQEVSAVLTDLLGTKRR